MKSNLSQVIVRLGFGFVLLASSSAFAIEGTGSSGGGRTIITRDQKVLEVPSAEYLRLENRIQVNGTANIQVQGDVFDVYKDQGQMFTREPAPRRVMREARRSIFISP